MSAGDGECDRQHDQVVPKPDSVVENEKSSNLLKDLGNDYSKYAQVDVKIEKNAVEEELDDLLTRLDEFSSLLDMVRSDDAMCLTTVLPEIYAKSQEMENLFTKIDKLEYAVTMIKQNMAVMEDKVTEAEYVLGGSSMKKLLSSLQKPLFSKKSGESKKSPKYDPPQIFHVEDLFVKEENMNISSNLEASSSKT